MTIKLSNININKKESIQLINRNNELERLLTELTEYITAKEMQLDTIKNINNTLQLEIKNLIKCNMNKNDV